MIHIVGMISRKEIFENIPNVVWNYVTEIVKHYAVKLRKQFVMAKSVLLDETV